MSDKKDQDEFHLKAVTPVGAVGIRKQGNKETLGILCPLTEGRALLPGAELVRSKKRDNEEVVDLTPLYSVPRKGPAKVSTPSYRKNHDRIFKNLDKTLN